MALTLDEIPTLQRLYKLSLLAAPRKALYSASAAYNSKICFLQHDITKLAVDAIVNAANTSLMGGGGVDGAIHRAAGKQLVAETATFDGCATGSAKISGAYRLPCKRVIHAVGPIYSVEKRRQDGRQERMLRGCYRKSLELAVKNDCRSIAFAAISTGVYGYPSDEAAETAIDEVRKFLDERKEDGEKIDRVVFCNFMDKDQEAYMETLPQFFPPADEAEDGDPSSEEAGEAKKSDGDEDTDTKTAEEEGYVDVGKEIKESAEASNTPESKARAGQ